LSAGVYRRESERRRELRARLGGGPVLLLDGATGTELERRGVRTPLPAWSAPALLEHPDVILAIHTDYARAGVEALTANTFRTQRRALAAAGLADRAAELTGRAVALARRAATAAGGSPFVLGSASPLEDCYRPDLVPDAAALEREHAEHVRHLADAGVDAVLVETMNTRREAEIATRAAVALDLPALASFVCWHGARLLSGEALRDAAEDVRRAGASAVLVNCLPPSNVGACLPVLAEVGLPFGAYANLGEPNDDTGFARSEECGPEAFAAHASGWVRAGAHIVGGCCGTTPEHLRAVRRVLGSA
jgi:S-methylmethionine-dependent homocysteine/selenocysteine methylase